MPSVGISYIAIVPLRFKQGRCLRGTQLVMLPVDLENLLGVLVGGKGGTREMKTGETNVKSILVQGRDHPRHIDQCRVLPNTSVMIGGIRS